MPGDRRISVGGTLARVCEVSIVKNPELPFAIKS